MLKIFRKKFDHCPTVEEMTPYVVNSFVKQHENFGVVKRKNLIEDVNKKINTKYSYIRHANIKGGNDPVLDHIIDLVIHNLKKDRFIKSIARGTYTF